MDEKFVRFLVEQLHRQIGHLLECTTTASGQREAMSIANLEATMTMVALCEATGVTPEEMWPDPR
jgi:hypothetical protein